MYSELTTLVPNEKMHFTHIGNLKNFEEQPLDEEAKAWTGAKENYTLTEQNGNTIITVEMDIAEQQEIERRIKEEELKNAREFINSIETTSLLLDKACHSTLSKYLDIKSQSTF